MAVKPVQLDICAGDDSSVVLVMEIIDQQRQCAKILKIILSDFGLVTLPLNVSTFNSFGRSCTRRI